MDILMVGLRGIGPDAQGGIEKHVEKLATHLDSHGLKVGIALRKPYAQKSIPPEGSNIKLVKLFSTRSKSFEALINAFSAVVYAGIKRPKLVHIHAVGPSLATPLAKFLGLKVVTTHHGRDYDREKWGFLARNALKCGEYFQAHFADARICVSASDAEHLSSKYKKVFQYIPNGIPENSESKQEANSRILEEFDLQGKKYILTVSRLVPEKRHVDLIEAFNKFQDENLKLVIVGAEDHPGKYTEMLDAASKENGNIILTGFRGGDDLMKLFQNAAIFALPSSHEGMPIALLEAMSYNLKVVISDIAPHLVLELPPTSYHEKSNPASLHAALKSQLDDKETDTADWRDFLRPFQWREVSFKTKEVYNSVHKPPFKSTLHA